MNHPRLPTNMRGGGGEMVAALPMYYIVCTAVMVPNGPRWAVVIWTCNKVINLLTQMIQSAARWRRQWRGGGEGVLRHGAVGLLSCAKKETSFRTLHCQATKGTAAGIYGAAVAKQWRGGGAHSAPLCRRWQCFATAVITCPRFPLVSNIFRSFFLFLAENTKVPNCLFFNLSFELCAPDWVSRMRLLLQMVCGTFFKNC